MDKVKREFWRLKAEGKIAIAKDIVTRRWVRNFKAGMFKKIKYNDRMNVLSEEDIGFCLLHEEGHFRHPIKKRHWLYFATPFLLFLLFWWVNMHVDVGASAGALAMFLFLCGIHVWIIDVYQNYEYKADEYACRNIPNPLERISVLDRIPKNKGNKWWNHFLSTLGADDMHPSIKKRKNRIREIFGKS